MAHRYNIRERHLLANSRRLSALPLTAQTPNPSDISYDPSHPTPSPPFIPRSDISFPLSRPTTSLPPSMPPPKSARKMTPPERALAKASLRLQLQHQTRAKNELLQLQTKRHSVVETFQSVSGSHKMLQTVLEHVETENVLWRTPNANLGDIYKMREEIEQAERRVRECHRRWDQLGGEIEEKHVEIAFGGE